MEFRKRPDFADTAYREAVSRLRILLAESYTPIKRPLRELDSGGDDTDNQSLISTGSRNSRVGRPYYHYLYPTVTPRRYYPHYYPSIRHHHQYPLLTSGNDQEKTSAGDVPKFEAGSTAPPPPPELMSFIERQEEYIEQLEKESTFCREELSSLLSKVKDVISENEHLHEKQKNKLIKSVFDQLETETETETDLEQQGKTLKSPKKTSRKTRLVDGPSIVFESRISELEAQLTQAKIDLKKAQEENEENKRKLVEGGGGLEVGGGFDGYRKQLEKIQREKDTLQDTVSKLQAALSKLRDKENDTCDQVKRSLDVAEQAQYEKNAAELEIRRLKDELERQHGKLRDAIADQGRRVADERQTAERRYTQQIDQLTTELGVQWETTNKLQLELDKQRRENGDLRREVAQKQALVDEMKKDLQNKIVTLQSDIGVSGAEKSALEQQIATLHMANERSERQSKQEIVRLQAEIQSLRQRLDRADADLIHSRRENIRLNEQVASLEKEINLSAALSDERNKTPRNTEIMALPPPAPKREEELSSMIHDMENKHAMTVAELEGMIHSQNQLMGKLSTECHALTQKLEDASTRHKEEIRDLQTNLDRLNNRFSQSQIDKSPIKDKTPAVRQNSHHKLPPTEPYQYSTNQPQEYPQDSQQYPSEADPNYQVDPNQMYPYDAGYAPDDQQQYMTQEQYDQMYANGQYPADPSQMYEGDPSQYQADPNQAQYEVDPNQGQYEVDPNQEQYAVDPSQTQVDPTQNQVDLNQAQDSSKFKVEPDRDIQENGVKVPDVKKNNGNGK